MQFLPLIVSSCYVCYIELPPPPARNENKNECSSVYIIQVIHFVGFVCFVGQFSFFTSYNTNTADIVLLFRICNTTKNL
jgi:hypothetical protein